MISFILDISKYIIIMLMALYVVSAFYALKRREYDFRGGLYSWLEILALLQFSLCMVNVWLINVKNSNVDVLEDVAFLGISEFMVLLFFPMILRLLYHDTARLLLCQMQMLLAIGFVMLARLHPAHAKRQFLIICVSLLLFFTVPQLIRKCSILRRIPFLYAGAGTGSLLLVLFSGRLVNGSRLSYEVMGLVFQPSEVIKIVFVFLIACLLSKNTGYKRLVVSALFAGLHVLILAASRDLGSALIFFVVYVAMVYVAGGKKRYLFAGVAGGTVAATAAYFLFAHVRSRVQVWLDPWADIDNKGYQLTQSLFGLATGGWFGMGLGHGAPRSIPFVEEDFVFSALAEELGVLFAILFVFLCLSVILAILLLAFYLKDPFYRLVATGLGICYGIQVLLTIGGGTGFIPLTGVTLPLISNGGTSAMVSILLFGILQGIYLLRMEEYDEEAEKKERLRDEWQDFLESEEAAGLTEEELAEKEESFFEAKMGKAERKQLANRYRQNRGIFVNAILYTVLFFMLSVHIVRFLLLEAGTVMTSSYNGKRVAILEQDHIRGTIFAADGTVLAETRSENGKEIRIYPYAEVFAHVVGYAEKGGDGIERKLLRYLITSDITLAKKLNNDLEDRKDPGNDVYTTLLPWLQQEAYNALGNYRGAVIVTDVKSGRVLAMVSKPACDPNRISELWDALITDEESGILVDRAAQGQYPPGSTFKIFTALEYIRENPEEYEDYRFDCNGQFSSEGSSIQCFHGSVHGEEDLTASFANSCNSSFANIGLSLDREAFSKTLEQMRFNEPIRFELDTNPSLIRMDAKLNTEDMMQTCIGQDKTQVSPLHINLVTAAIANGGTMMQPYVIDRVVTADGRLLRNTEPEEYGRVMSTQEAQIMTGLMTEVVQNGTGKRLRELPFTVAGKTGSAEFSTIKAQSHAWFTGFAPVDDPQIAITVIMENAGSGGEMAAPVAGEVLSAYFECEK